MVLGPGRPLRIAVIVLQWNEIIFSPAGNRFENKISDLWARHSRVPYSLYFRCPPRRAGLSSRAVAGLSPLSRRPNDLSGRRHCRRLAVALRLVLAAGPQRR